jgi:molecular chaperone DnaK
MSRSTIDFGIDLGTTNSAIAYMRGSIPDIVKNNWGVDITPSVVYFNSRGDALIGTAAISKLENSNDTYDVHSTFKRIMGTDHAYEFKSANRSLLPEEMSAEVLKALRADVQVSLAEDIAAAVITVPAAFEQRQCAATIKAAHLAGLKQCALIQEPVAAALAYGFQSSVVKEHWLIYDFGGGTFDAALIKAEDGNICVVNHGGDNHLGGSDIDHVVMDLFVIPELTDNFNLPGFSRGNDSWRAPLACIKHAVENAKIQLSRSESAYIEFRPFNDADGNEVAAEIKFTRNQLIDIAEPILLSSVDICRRVLSEKGMQLNAVGRVILVGGPTLAPWFREILKANFDAHFDHSVDPLTVVARGAAVFAGTQRLESHAVPKAKSGSFAVKCIYSAMGPDTDPKVRGEVSSSDGTSIGDFTIEFVNTTEDAKSLAGWRSGRIAIKPDGKFSARLNAEKGCRNSYRIELFDEEGSLQKTEPDSIEYIVTGGGGVIVEQPFCHDIAVALTDNTKHVYFKKGDAYPAKNTYRKFRTTKALQKGESGEALRIPIVEGNEDKADWNYPEGALVILGSKVRRDVPVNSEVEITIHAKQPGELLVQAYIPFLDEEFEAYIRYDRSIPDSDFLDKQCKAEVKRLGDVRNEAENTGDACAHGLLGAVPDAGEIKNLIQVSRGDPDSAKKAQKRLIELRKAIDQVEDQLKWPALVAEMEKGLDDLDRLVDAHGTSAQQEQARILRDDVEKLIEQKRHERLRRKLDEIKSLNAEILLNQDGFWLDYFYYLANSRSSLNDADSADRLINQGRLCIDKGNIQGLRNVVRQLHGLLPQQMGNEASGVIRAHGSDIIK